MARPIDEMRKRGRELRKSLPRSAHAELALPERDPVAILVEQHASRLADLVPVRIGRMLESPFTYYRGTAAVMAHDLAAGPDTGQHVIACGDAHISNFGFFASPERRVLFDLNDFDEGGVAPWEWDVKRMAASIHIGGRDINLTEEQCSEAVETATRAYRETLAQLFELTALERFYFRVESDDIEAAFTGENRNLVRKTVRKARTRTSDQVLEKMAVRSEDGVTRIVDQEPVCRHVNHASLNELDMLFHQYSSTIRQDSSVLLSQYRLVDYVLRVVGVGSVGTRCYVLLFEGPAGEALFLQAKEAQPSVLATYGGLPATVPGAPKNDPDGHSEGRRVVAAQRTLQAQSDPFLGWITGWAGERGDRPRVDYFWRQFRDMKGSMNLAKLDAGQFTEYGVLCARLLARAHSQSPGAATIRGYLGGSDTFDSAIATWSRLYADACERDYEALSAAAESGRIPVSRGV